ncbi:MAG: sulfatase-like hydrolase/transferase [Rikenellaceae bacterium]
MKFKLQSTLLLVSSCCVVDAIAAPKQSKKIDDRPNVIVILIDDIGSEAIDRYEGIYPTPNIDAIGENGITVTHFLAQPLSSPTRVKLMTGKRNYRNYTMWTYLDLKENNFAKMAQKEGYKTCVAGKWQLGGDYEHMTESDLPRLLKDPYRAGFDEYCLYDLYRVPIVQRYGNVGGLSQNGKLLDTSKGDYGPDVYNKFVTDFIEKNRDDKFFVYYPMCLIHAEYEPTPESAEYADYVEQTYGKDENRRKFYDKKHYYDMVDYADKMIGEVIQTLKDNGVYENTIVMCMGDNGTAGIMMPTVDGPRPSGKGSTKYNGVRVPMLMQWPARYAEGGHYYQGVAEMCDILPTVADAIGAETDDDIDGVTMLPLFDEGRESYVVREVGVVNYDPLRLQMKNPLADLNVRGRFAQTTRYKLYNNGDFYDMMYDPYERYPITEVSAKDKPAYDLLKAELDRIEEDYPWVDVPEVYNQFMKE